MLKTSIALVLIFASLFSATAYAQTPKPDFKARGLEVLERIEADYAIPNSALYADEWRRGQAQPGSPAFMWGAGVQLSALAAATRIQPEVYTARLKRFVSALEVYWVKSGGGGYDVLPLPKPLDRYYDDNMWVALALAEAFETTQDTAYLDKAEAVYQFIMSGEDAKLGGGIYWKEAEKSSKNACSNAPATALALRLYQLTKKQTYLDTARRLYAWTNAHLQDKDGLYWDNIKLDGSIEKTKWSYNTALMLRSNCLFYAITHEKRYRNEAERIARSAEARWVKADTGAIADDGAFAHLLAEAFLAVGAMDGDGRWSDIVTKALEYVYANLKDDNGHFSDKWGDSPVTRGRDKVGLLGQASVARALLRASKEFGAEAR